ncbi:unnamed protein product [Paramecium primaurelia]|uniref:H(+)-exporting diphosphatase n=1 Tax=Paramecium primaurelia TaxID=5886 RepID=A0A8S1LAM9_PARPR|nr:unnamed protein product [Paramecium primaurelia]
MVGYSQDVRHRIDQLDAAGNCTAAIGKGFAIGSAALVAFSLYGALLLGHLTLSINIHQQIQESILLQYFQVSQLEL